MAYVNRSKLSPRLRAANSFVRSNQRFGELLGIIDRQEKMEMRGHENRGMDTDRNLRLSSAQDTANDFVQGRARAQQELGLESGPLPLRPSPDRV